MSANDSDAPLTRLTELLTSAGYRAKIEGETVVSSAGGAPFGLRWYPDSSVQLASGASNVPQSFDLAAVNAFNGHYRFGTLYRDENDLILHASFFMDLDAPDAGDRIEQILSVYEGLVAELRECLEQAEDAIQPDA